MSVITILVLENTIQEICSKACPLEEPIHVLYLPLMVTYSLSPILSCGKSLGLRVHANSVPLLSSGDTTGLFHHYHLMHYICDQSVPHEYPKVYVIHHQLYHDYVQVYFQF